MDLDPQLLEQAKMAGARLEEAERQALLARTEYHTAIRRLHLGGGSLRAIAETLSISHQRVQQIVSGAGGSWWRRIWRTRTIRPDAVCTWCTRPPSEVSKLIAGPAVMDSLPNAYAGMDTTAEVVARQFNISREDQDAFAVQSHQRAAAAIAAG